MYASRGLITSAYIVLVSGQALAQSPSAPVSWSGPYVEIGLGGALIDSEAKADASVREDLDFTFLSLNYLQTIDDAISFGENFRTGFVTVGLGYDFQQGNAVFGGLFDFEFYPDGDHNDSAKVDGRYRAILNGATVIDLSRGADVKSSLSVDSVWSVGGRFGYLLQPSVLIYGLGGYTEANITQKTTLNYENFQLSGSLREVSTEQEKLRGYFLGAGAEVMVANNLSFKLEYRFSQYDGVRQSNDAEFTDNSGTPFITYERRLGIDSEVDLVIHSVRGALVFHLN